MSETAIEKILEGLDETQRQAASQLDGPVLIVAGAGSGKTRVLTSRMAMLLEKGVPPFRILALTFTRKAAGEMKERIASMAGSRKASMLVMGTFHSVFARFLRQYAPSLGYPSSFTIYDTSDSQSLIKHCIKDLGLDEKIYKPRDVLSRISMAKNNNVSPAAYRDNVQVMANDRNARKPRLCDIYDLYQARMLQSGVMDFDDMLMNMVRLLAGNPEAAEDICGRFDYVLVDEYQDTNRVQYMILGMLARRCGNICVVGDDSQSIYAFRGARIENILSFRKDWPGCKVFRLERNYRSTQTIVDAANALIEHNAGRIPKTCFSAGDRGEKIRLIKSYTELEEGLLIASSIVSRMQQDSAAYSDFAVLYRTNAQSRAIEEALRKRNLPYMVYSGNSFYERAEVKDMLAYFKLAVNPSDDESFRRVVNKPARGIGATSVDALTALARQAGVPLISACTAEDASASALKPAAAGRLKAFAAMVEGWNKAASEGVDAWTLAQRIASESTLLAFYREDTSMEGKSRTANVEEVINSVRQFVEERKNDYVEGLMAEGSLEGDADDIPDSEVPGNGLSDYLENIALLSAVDVSDEDSDNKIALMTVHSAKGLEFPYVYVAGMEENLFPSVANMTSATELEEERRLFYVAVTRAGKALTISYAATRMRNGKTEQNPPSRFIKELGPEYFQGPLPSAQPSGWQSLAGGTQSSGRQSLSGGVRSGQNRQGGMQSWQPRQSSGSSGPSRTGYQSPSRTGAATGTFARPAASAPFAASPVYELRPGQRVEHSSFGIGTILSITGSAQDLKAQVDFGAGLGIKTLLLKFAKLRILNP